MKKIGLIFVLVLGLLGCQQNQSQVVVYTSVDQIYSEPFFKQFEADTGIQVLANYDVEASKTTGLVSKLIAEKDYPVADVFWNGEFSQTIKLKEAGVLTSYKSPATEGYQPNYVDSEGYWTAFGGRARVYLVNHELLTPEEYPTSIYDLTDQQYKNTKKAMAKPLFGTTATQAAALYAYWGEKKAKAFYQALEDNEVRIVDGNAVVRDLVSEGEIAFGLTDTDDALSAVEKGKPVSIVIPDQMNDQMGTLMIPNTVAMIKNAKNQEEAKVFIDYILSQESEEKLIEMGWCQMAVHEVTVENPHMEIHHVKFMDLGLEDIYAELDRSQEGLKSLFMK